MRLHWIACLCLLANLGAASAQEPPAEDAEALENAEPAQPEAAPDAESADIKDGATEAAAPKAPPPTPGRSPDTFRPSEEISEDLSVSFPVDI